MIDKITIDGVVYVRADTVRQPAALLEGKPYQIVRTYTAGVFAGYVESRNGQEVVMRQARRLWYWDGAATLSQLAIDGVAAPQNCKFPEAVDRIELLQVIEILDVTEKARLSIAGVKLWKR